MANVSHKNLTGNQLHENKGVDSATVDQVATASGGGATVWKKLTASNLTGSGNPFGGQLLHVREEQSAGVTSSSSVTNFSWNTQVLNTVKTNEISGASLASNVITLPAGTYFIKAEGCPYEFTTTSGGGSKSRTKLKNNTAGTTLLIGVTQGNVLGGSGFGSVCPLVSRVEGRFTLAGTSNVELQTYIYFNNSVSVPNVQNIGEVEVYAEVFIWKVA